MAETPPPQTTNGLVKSLLILAGFFVTMAIVALYFWLTYWRYEEVTDDAYINGNRLEITSQIEGRTLSYFADNTNYVIQGQLLVQLDPKDFELAFQEALSSLAFEIRYVRQLINRTKEQQAIIKQKELEYDRLTLEYNRRKELVDSGAVAQEDFTNSRAIMDKAIAEIEAATLELHALRAISEGTDIPNHPLVLVAIQKTKQAYLNLERCCIYAPASGFVAERSVQVGQWVTNRDTLLSIIPLDQIWTDANFKETQLTHVRIGQPVSLISDVYGTDLVFHGKVVGIGAGTGSVFSILPPQNATGNWIKIVQRVPVKISLDPIELLQHPLWLGLSMTATVDTHDRSGLRLAENPSAKEVATTSIYKNELDGIDDQIERILAENGAYE